ncbi:MAG: H-NS family nucleoid-associated regulatory protein (plasmid) [Arsenophonus sp.]|nr:MAG: H-NS family nucleoid-associated regulatory protein [Arsenophonus sp.]
MNEITKQLTKEAEYKIISKHLSSITTLRKFALTKNFDWLQEVKDKLEAIIEENKDAYEKAKKEAEKKEKKRLDLIKLIEDNGFNLHSLLEPVITKTINKKKKNNVNTRKPKYKFLDENGDIQTWSGNGKPPTRLQKLLNNGNSLDKFLIKNY